MTRRSFDIIPDEWHFTREGLIVRALLGMCIILCVIVFLCPDCLLWKLYRQDHGMLCACAGAPVCVRTCVQACTVSHSQYCLSLPPITLISISCFSPYISYLQSWEVWAPDMDGIYYSSLRTPATLLLLSTAAFVCFSAHSCACETRTVAALLDPHGHEPWPSNQPLMGRRFWWASHEVGHQHWWWN